MFGCNDQNTVRPGPNGVPTTPASAVFSTPAFDGELIRRYTDTPEYRSVDTKHTGSSLYSGAYTEIFPLGSNQAVLSLPNRDYRNDGVYFTKKAPNQNSFNPAEDGRYRIKATYTTFIPSAGAGFEVQSVPSSLNFRLCYSTNFDCIAAGRAENQKNQEVAERMIYCPEEPMPTRAATPAAQAEASRCGGYSGGGGGGGGGDDQIPYHLRRVPITRSMEPFFVMTNVGSSVSESEVRAAMYRSTPGQLDDIAEIMLEVYDEDIYDYAHDNARAARSSTDSPFLVLAEALASGLDARPETNISGQRAFLTGLRARYEVAAALEDEPQRGASAPTFSVAEARAADASVRAWPNPAVGRVTVQTDAAATGAEVYDVMGRRVARLAVSPDGVGSVAVWDLSADGGGRVAPGLYQIVVSGDARRAVSVTVL